MNPIGSKERYRVLGSKFDLEPSINKLFWYTTKRSTYDVHNILLGGRNSNDACSWSTCVGPSSCSILELDRAREVNLSFWRKSLLQLGIIHRSDISTRDNREIRRCNDNGCPSEKGAEVLKELHCCEATSDKM